MKKKQEQEFLNQHISQFPHCDPKILHAPATCEYCDEHPDWQALRIAWSIAFTGELKANKIVCPAEQARSFKTLNAWHGNKKKDSPDEDGTE